jgi:hypothetical protein
MASGSCESSTPSSRQTEGRQAGRVWASPSVYITSFVASSVVKVSLYINHTAVHIYSILSHTITATSGSGNRERRAGSGCWRAA